MGVKVKADGGGIGFFGLLTILFVGLKLTGHVAWPWYWVLSPMWIPAAIVVGVLLIVAVGIFVAELVK